MRERERERTEHITRARGSPPTQVQPLGKLTRAALFFEGFSPVFLALEFSILVAFTFLLWGFLVPFTLSHMGDNGLAALRRP